jgi:site-specific DNA-cytosine methylase
VATVRIGSLFSGIGGFDKGFEDAGWEIAWQVEIEPFCRKILERHFPSAVHGANILTCRGLTASVPAFRAKTFRSRGNGLGSRVIAQSSFTSLQESCGNFDPLGLCSRMFPDFSVQTRDETLQKSSGFSWSSAGMGFNGACSTASFSESPNVANVCSLSDILERHVPQRFYLSPRACRGVLRRAEKRGRTLLSRLQAALAFVGSLQDDEWKTITTWLFSPPAQDTMDIRPTEVTVTRLLQRVQERERARLQLLATNGMTKTPTHSSLEPSDILVEAAQVTTRGRQDTLFPLTLRMPEQAEETCAEHSTPATADTMLPELRLDTIWLVRRLTPTECEILQNFPRGWTLPGTERSATR